jgi:hypothetical protein
MMAKEKTFQFVLTASECKLFRLLRELEADFQTEYPMIYHGADPKLFVTRTLCSSIAQLMEVQRQTIDTFTRPGRALD